MTLTVSRDSCTAPAISVLQDPLPGGDMIFGLLHSVEGITLTRNCRETLLSGTSEVSLAKSSTMRFTACQPTAIFLVSNLRVQSFCENKVGLDLKKWD